MVKQHTAHTNTLQLLVTTGDKVSDRLPPTGRQRIPVSGVGLPWLQHNVAIMQVPGMDASDAGESREGHKSPDL